MIVSVAEHSLIQIIKNGGKNMIENKNNEKNLELEKEEVNVYGIPECDQVRKDCLNDCIGGGAFISTTK